MSHLLQSVPQIGEAHPTVKAMSRPELGQLVPVGGGDAIPLLRERLSLGRRETCDICLQLPSISSEHCEFTYTNGYWFVQDLGSTNGIKVNGIRVVKRALTPGDEITIAKRNFRIEYTPPVGTATLDEMLEDVDETMAQSLLEKAGLVRPQNRPSLRHDKKKPSKEAKQEPKE